MYVEVGLRNLTGTSRATILPKDNQTTKIDTGSKFKMAAGTT